MATQRTQFHEALHTVGHQLLALVGSIAVAALPIDRAMETIRTLTDMYAMGDYDALRVRVERILRDHSGAVNMENVIRHAHELRRAIRDFQRVASQS